MSTSKDYINRHALAIYFVLVFIISWGAILLLVGPDGIPATADQAVMLGMAMLLGPTVAGVLMTGFTSGRAGNRELLSRLIRWRVSARWYAVALLIAPLTTAFVLMALSFFSKEFMPSLLTSDNKAALIGMGIISGLIVGLFEEIGWTGFATPQMRLRYSILATGLVIGILWGAWHFLLFWERDSFSAIFPLVLMLARLFSWLPAYRIIMVWVYDHTESLLVTILMHASLVATLAIFDPALTGGELLTLILVRSALLWVIVLVITVVDRGQIENDTIG
jgi:membrane protease YdiL (CAAX protease family)